jgi:hypothetical protein
LIEKQFPGCTALFLAGAGADQDPAPRGTIELTEEHGAELAEAVTIAAAYGGEITPRTLSVAFENISLDLQPSPTREKLEADLGSTDAPLRRKAAWLLERMKSAVPLPSTQSCPVQVICFGNLVYLIGLGGEPVVEFAQHFKREFPAELVWTAGYSNDMFGYLPTKRVLQEGGYEGGRAVLWSALPAPLAESAEERVLACVRRLASSTNQNRGNAEERKRGTD